MILADAAATLRRESEWATRELSGEATTADAPSTPAPEPQRRKRARGSEDGGDADMTAEESTGDEGRAVRMVSVAGETRRGRCAW